MRLFFLIAAFSAASFASAQCDGWQQHIQCDLTVDLDVHAHRFTGTEKLVYENNSPDTLRELYFHLYFNAFKPGSEMDVRSRTIIDPDPRVGDRIAALTPDEMGDLHCSDMMQGKGPVKLESLGTVLRVTLPRPILPGKRTTLTFNFNGQVPVQILRSGHDNAEGIAYSMTQWFPKVAVYDERGWHADPYVGREFYGEWGDYDVKIALDRSFTVAATGVLQNANEIGHGYAPVTREQKRSDGKLLWHFKADRVHDFAWSADPGYVNETVQVPNGPLLRFIYQDGPKTHDNWKQLPAYMVKAFEYMDDLFGKYPWPVFTFAQGGDRGMEYPMLTLINGERNLGGLVGTSVHELIHSWYYGVLASDELSYPWMDEGFDQYVGAEVKRVVLPQPGKQDRVHQAAIESYLRFVDSPDREPMTVAADHFTTSRAYSVDAYTMGEVLLDQLGAVIGDSTLHRGLLRYFNTCGSHHPNPLDVQRIMEKESGLQLDWYFNEWINTLRKLDYAVNSVTAKGDSTVITLERNEEMLMPTDVAVQGIDASVVFYHIPLSLELGARKERPAGIWQTLKPWQWTDPTYSFIIATPISQVQEVKVDPFGRLGDVDRKNDSLTINPGPQINDPK